MLQKYLKKLLMNFGIGLHLNIQDLNIRIRTGHGYPISIPLMLIGMTFVNVSHHLVVMVSLLHGSLLI